MKTPEEIKKGLEHCTTDGADCTGCIYRDECMEEYDNAPLQRDALAYIQQLEAQVPKWISVEERLPNIEETVIVAADDGYVYAAQLFGNGCWRKEQIGCIRADTGVVVTHWMPLPEGPKEG